MVAAAAISVRLSELVFDARIVSLGQIAESCLNRSCLRLSFSGAASTTRWHCESDSRKSAVEMRASVASRASGVT